MYSQVSKHQLFYVGPGELDPRNPSSWTVFGQYDLQQELLRLNQYDAAFQEHSPNKEVKIVCVH